MTPLEHGGALPERGAAGAGERTGAVHDIQAQKNKSRPADLPCQFL
jgi:hypothetical protein